MSAFTLFDLKLASGSIIEISNNVVVVVAVYKPANNIHSVWTAGYRVNATNSPSSFIWRVLTGDRYFRLPHTFTDWVPTDPGGGVIEYCMGLYVHRNYRWFDMRCTTFYRVLCEIDIA